MSRRFVQMKDGSLVEVPKHFVQEPTAPTVIGDTPGYLSQATGRWVEGRAQRREDLAVSGCRPFEGAQIEQQEAARNRAYNEAARDARVEEATRRAYYQIPYRHRRAIDGR